MMPLKPNPPDGEGIKPMAPMTLRSEAGMTLTLQEIIDLLEQSKKLVGSQSELPQSVQNKILISIIEHFYDSNDFDFDFLSRYATGYKIEVETFLNCDFRFDFYCNTDSFWCTEAATEEEDFEGIALATVRGDLAKELIDRLKPLCLKWAFGET